MAASSDVTVTQESPGNVKMHPYLVTLVRWCVSCLWSTATVLLHRIMTAPLQPITGPKPSKIKSSRLAGTEHLHPEPRVSCELLHQPREHTLDVIFVHGLYGSLGNTWRQGEWRSKYEKEPKKLLLKQHSEKTCNCHKPQTIDDNLKNDKNYTDFHETEMTINKVNEKLFKKIIPQENDLITEQFYNNTLLDQVEVFDNYETQAKFVSDLFKRETHCDIICDDKNNLKMFNSNEKSVDNFDNGTFTSNDCKTCNEKLNSNDACKENCNDKCKTFNDNCKTINDKIKTFNDKSKTFNDKCKTFNDNCKTCNDNCKTFNDKNKTFNDNCKTFNDKSKTFNDKCKNSNVCENCNNKCKTFNDKNKTFNDNCKTFNDKCKTCNSVNKSEDSNECKCERQCEVGCGCVCDNCYSTCWPKDWIQKDFPGARVISVNYTSDPYLWRPLWIRENKRLSLHVRADQMMSQLLSMGVGSKPVVWVGHSKGGLFIKQIYCEAFESYKKLNNTETMQSEVKANPDFLRRVNSTNNDAVLAETIDHIVGNMFDKQMNNMTFSDFKEQSILNGMEMKKYPNINIDNITNIDTKNDEQAIFDDISEETITNNDKTDHFNDTITNINTKNEKQSIFDDISEETIANNDKTKQFNDTNALNAIIEATVNNNSNEMKSKNIVGNNIDNLTQNCERKRPEFESILSDDLKKDTEVDSNENNMKNNEFNSESSSIEVSKARLFSRSRGFMFYSVPHRGSPLADIKTPVTARSLELLEISKDCPLVLNLHSRWVAGAGRGRPRVRGVVETCRTLMSVLWLTIVSETSADAGIGSLLGVSVDHREICKPSSRNCMLYKELVDLINEALCDCEC